MFAGCVNAYSVLAAPSVPSASTGYESISPVSCCAKSDPSGPSDIVNDDDGHALCERQRAVRADREDVDRAGNGHPPEVGVVRLPRAHEHRARLAIHEQARRAAAKGDSLIRALVELPVGTDVERHEHPGLVVAGDGVEPVARVRRGGGGGARKRAECCKRGDQEGGARQVAETHSCCIGRRHAAREHERGTPRALARRDRRRNGDLTECRDAASGATTSP